MYLRHTIFYFGIYYKVYQLAKAIVQQHYVREHKYNVDKDKQKNIEMC